MAADYQGVAVKSIHTDDMHFSDGDSVAIRDGHLYVESKNFGTLAVFAPGKWNYAQLIEVQSK